MEDIEAPESDYDYDDAADDGWIPEFDDEPDISAEYEFNSSMESAGWGTSEDYGYYGGDEDY